MCTCALTVLLLVISHCSFEYALSSLRPESAANGYDHSVTSLDGRVAHRVTQVLSHWFVEPGTVHCTHMASSHQISAQRSTFSHWGFIPLKLGLYWEVLGFQLGLGCPKNILVETVGLCMNCWISDSSPVPILSKVTSDHGMQILYSS